MSCAILIVLHATGNGSSPKVFTWAHCTPPKQQTELWTRWESMLGSGFPRSDLLVEDLRASDHWFNLSSTDNCILLYGFMFRLFDLLCLKAPSPRNSKSHHLITIIFLLTQFPFQAAITRVMHAPMSFFDTTVWLLIQCACGFIELIMYQQPLGRIMNRFSKGGFQGGLSSRLINLNFD